MTATRRYSFIAIQLAIAAAANTVAFELRFDGNPPAWALTAWLQMLPWLLVVRAITFRSFGLNRDIWRYTSLYDVIAIVKAVGVGSLIFVALTMSPIGPDVYPRSVFIIDAIVAIAALSGVRVSRHVLRELAAPLRRREKPYATAKRLLIIGAGAVGEMLVREMQARPDYGYQPIGFIDDDPSAIGRHIHGVKVLGTRGELADVLAAHRPHEILIAIPDADPAVLRSIVQALEHHNIPIKMLPRLQHLLNGTFELGHIRTLGFEDLLARAPVGLDDTPLRALIGGRRVLVTGAGGSIGGELCRQIAAMNPSSCVMLDRNENGLHALHLELRDRHDPAVLHPVIGDVTDAARIDEVFSQYRPEIVFHAAAHKHVPMMEGNPCEAIKNNVTGTATVADAAMRHASDRFIFISTDKAVNPTSVMGASKRLAELVVRARAMHSETTAFATVRFGNVLGSSGSVVPLFLEQIRKGGPVTVTHPEVRRFFMLIPEAVQLVLHAAAQPGGAATYVLEMGEQVKLVDMARHLIRVSGFVPDRDIAIRFIGLRPGEKLREELVGDLETVRPSRVSKILRVTEKGRPSDVALRMISAIERSAKQNDTETVMVLLGRLLPTYGATTRGGAETTSPAAVAAEPEFTTQEVAMANGAGHVCHVCRSGRLRRTHARSLVERITRSVGEKRLFECDECGWRGRCVPLDFGSDAPDRVTQTPDLRQIDAAVSTIPLPRQWRSAPRAIS